MKTCELFGVDALYGQVLAKLQSCADERVAPFVRFSSRTHSEDVRLSDVLLRPRFGIVPLCEVLQRA
jgi:hypothetical protein